MRPKIDTGRAQWRSLTSYVLVTAGAVIGMGNFLGFPIYMIRYGVLFLIFYLLCEVIIAVPILFTELLIGRRGRQNPVGSFSILSMEEHASNHWRNLGWLCFFILILSLPLYIASVSFPVEYFFYSLKMVFSHSGPLPYYRTLDKYAELLVCFIVFLAPATLLVMRGINKGIETISCIIVPFYAVVLTILAIYINSKTGLTAEVQDLLSWPPHQSLFTVFSAGLIYAFFKLNIGMGTMIVYGTYLPYNVSLAKSTIMVILLDAFVSIASYLIICPLTIKSHLVYLTSESAYIVFSSSPGNYIIASLFFLTTIMGTWLPTIAMIEAATVILIERFFFSRPFATLVVSFIAFLLGAMVIFSNLRWRGIFSIQYRSMALWLNDIVTIFLMPISAMLMAIFIGWIVSKETTKDELEFGTVWYKIWLFLVRFIVPIAIVAVMALSVLNAR